MRTGIHPKYHKTKITCVCGAEYEVGTTKETLRVEICAKCHPFYTGKQRIVDAGGRVERFRRKYKGFDAAGTDEDEDKKSE